MFFRLVQNLYAQSVLLMKKAQSISSSLAGMRGNHGWMECYSWLGIQTAMPKGCKEHFRQQGLDLMRGTKGLVMLIWCACIWCLWASRNDMVFKTSLSAVSRIVENVKLKTWNWLRSRVKGFMYSFFEWQSNPLHCLASIKI